MVRSTFLGFETAKRALSISQAGLDTVGHNISNASTAGYTRQRVDQVSISMNGVSSKYQSYGAGSSVGMGSTLQGIRQVRDPYLDNRYRTAATNNGELGIRQDGLTDISNILDEIMSDGLFTKMSDVLDKLAVLGQSANLKDHATVVRDTVDQLVSIMNKNANQLEEARDLKMSDLKVAAEQDVNTILEKIAQLNKKIKEGNVFGNPSNELNDERNMLIDNLSEYFDIKVVRTPVQISSSVTVETVSIELNNSGNPPLKLVDGKDYNKLSVSEDPKNGNAIVSLLDGASDMPIVEDLSNMLKKGGIKGYLDIINGEGPNSGGNTYRGIPYYMNALDEYAQQIAEILNRVNNVTEQESLNSGASYDAVLTGSAFDWLQSIDYGQGFAIDFAGRNTNMAFTYDGTAATPTVTATFNDADGNSRIGKADYTPGADGKISFYEVDGNGDPVLDGTGNPVLLFTAEVRMIDSPPTTPVTPKNGTELLVDAGWPPIPSTGDNKNILVPLLPTVTDSDTGKQPEWIDTISGGVMQFSGKEYGITFNYNPAGFGTPPDATKNMSATMTDSSGKIVTYYGTYNKNGKVDFRDDRGAVMFTVKTTTAEPDAGLTSTTVDAKITAKNISVSQNWFEDPLYITTTKNGAINSKTATLTLDGTKNPVWLDKVVLGPDSVAVPDSTYQFYYTNDPPRTDAEGNKEIAVKINGIEYKGYYKTSSTIDLVGGVPEKVGLTIVTNYKKFGEKDSENAATIKNDTGAKNDNINKLISELKAPRNYSVSGIRGGCQDYLQSLHAQMGSDNDYNSSMLDASTTVITTLADRRDSISAVSLDEEGVNMMTYQNYYNAAARYMTVLDEALDKIINGMGIVGR